MKIEMRYDTGNGEQTVALAPSTFIKWEKANKRTTASLADGIGLADMAFLVHAQLERNGENPGTLDEFTDRLVDIGVATSDPT